VVVVVVELVVIGGLAIVSFFCECFLLYHHHQYHNHNHNHNHHY